MSQVSEVFIAAQPPLEHLLFPPEIRDRIYKLLLSREKTDSSFPTRTNGSETQFLNLLLLSKTTCLGAFHIFYQYSNLAFDNVHKLYLFLKNIGSARRDHITHLTIIWDGAVGSKETCRMLQYCSNLKHLDIVVTAAYMDTEAAEVLMA